MSLPTSLTFLGSSAFYGCSSLTEVSLPDTLKTVSSSCFSSCTALEEVTIPRSVTTIDSYAFRYNSALTNVWLEGAPPTVGSYVFSGVASGARGHYPRSLASQWLPKIDSNGKWNGLIMHELSQPVLRVKEASPAAGSITLAWDDGTDDECVSSYAIYRGPGTERLPEYFVEGGITDTEWTDTNYWNAEPVLSPLHYWVVAENDHFDIPESNAVETRRRYALSVGYDQYGSKNIAHKAALADAQLFKSLTGLKGGYSSEMLLNPKVTDIREALTALTTISKAGDCVLFYVATHGDYIASNSVAYLLGADETEYQYFVYDLVEDVDQFDPGVTFVGTIMACHSQAMVDSDGNHEDAERLVFQLENGLARCSPNVVWIASCGTTENSYSFSGLTNTLFGEWFLAQGWQNGYADYPSLHGLGYSGGNGDGTNTMHELVQYARAFARGVSDYGRSTVYVSENGEDILDRVVVATNVSPLSIEPPVSVESIEAEKGQSDSKIGVSWTSAPTAVMYLIDRCIYLDPTPEGQSSWEWIGTTAETRFDDIFVIPFVDFLYRVRTVNPIGISSPGKPDLGRAGTREYQDYLLTAANQLGLDDELPSLPSKQAASGISLQDCYIAGLNPTEPDARFEARIDMTDGEPVVTPFPDLGTNRVYTVVGKSSLSDPDEDWHEPDASSRFFRVKVSLPE